jgi:ABC-type transport system involved in multi-copper enzyme maturation permease subunit
VLAASVLLLVLATVCVRRAALRQATGQAGFLGSLKERRIAVHAKTTTKAHPEATAGKIRPVKGPPLIWKELRGSLARVRRGNRVVGSVIAAALLVVVYGYCAYVGYLWVSEVHTGFVAAYLFLGLFRTATYSATSITSEKEARTWPILLATPLRDRQIIIEKIAGSSVRPWPVWLLLGGHALVFSLAGLIDPAAILPLTLLVLSSALMVSAVGVFFSSCFRKTSLAATVNLIVFFVSVVPVCCPLPIFFVSPVLVAVMILGAAQHGSGARAFAFWPRFGVASSNDLLAAVFAFLALVLVYWLITFILFALATSNVRRRVF